MARRALLGAVAMTVPGLAGCTLLGRNAPSPTGSLPSVGIDSTTSRTGGEATQPRVDDDSVEPFVVKGMVTYADGRPLVGAEVFADNTLVSNSNLKTLSDEAGRYRIEIPDTYQTSWQSRGWINIDYHGDLYRRELDVDNDPFQTNHGAIRDLVLKLSGPMTRAPGGNGHGHRVTFNQELTVSGAYHEYPKIEVTLVPVGPLLDGSPGETITQFVEGQDLTDIPIGQYEAFVRHHAGDGGQPADCEVRLRFEEEWHSSAVGVMPPELELTFEYRIPD